MGRKARRKEVYDAAGFGKRRLIRGESRPRYLRERHLILVSEMYVQGYSLCEIAEKLNVSPQTTRKDLIDIRNMWKEKEIANFNEYKDQQLRKIDLVELEAWRAWERSKQPQKTVVRKSAPPEEVVPGVETQAAVYETVETETQEPGDPRFLQIIGGCIERRCRLLGLDAPQRIIAPDGNTIPQAFTDTERSRALVELFKLAAAQDGGSDSTKSPVLDAAK